MILLHFTSETGEYVTFINQGDINKTEAMEYARPNFTLEGAWSIDPLSTLANSRRPFMPGDGDVYLLDR